MARLLLSFASAAALLLSGLVAGAPPPVPLGTFDGPMMALPGHTPAALADSRTVRVKSLAAGADPVTLTVVLRRFDPQGFSDYLRDVYDPSSPNFRKYLSPRELSDRFGPSADDYAIVKSYFAQNGFALRDESANRMTLTVEAGRATVERALSVAIDDYRIEGKSFRANGTDPQVPGAVADRVEAIVGLSSLATPEPSKFAIIRAYLCYAVYGTLKLIGAGDSVNFFGIENCIKWAQGGSGPGGTGASADKKSAGQANAVPIQSATGAGQTIGIVAFDNYIASDLADNVAIYNMPPSRLTQVTQVHVNGGAAPGANQLEVLLDVILPLYLAPGASIVIHDAPLTTSFQAVFNSMINGGVTIISNSWSYCEDQTTSADVLSLETLAQTAAASGITILNASGDTGSTCLDGRANTVGVPASTPHATAVGGTSLEHGPGLLTYGSETWWGAASPAVATGAGGFGVSRFFSRPSYQDGVSAATMRSIPDVAVAADPEKDGIPLCIAAKGGCPSGLIVGGTSMSAPLMASYIALLNQSLGANLGFLNAALYPLAGTASFHSPASMSSDFSHVGLGSPNLAMMHAALSSTAIGPVSPTESRVIAVPVAPTQVWADGTNKALIGVLLRDANGHPVAGRNVTLTPSIVGHVVIAPASALTDSNGAAVFTLTNLTVENVTFTAKDTTGNITLATTPVVSFVVPPAASGGIVGSPTTVQNDGTSVTTITVTLKDALNRPTPGKQIALSQGSGRSIVASPTPAVTDVNGVIAFTATNRFAETVTYTAIDVSDGNLPVPGNAIVTFSGQANNSCSSSAPPLAAGPGYSISTFATGFLTSAFFYSNVNWGCGGASNPAFDVSGNAYIADFPNGKLYKFGVGGGAATDGNVIFGQGPTLVQPAFGKTGKLYATRSATGAGFTTGSIFELNPITGAVGATLATNLTCPTAPAVDPISGDLFFTDACFGAGSDNPSLFRIQGTLGNSPTVVTYATLPATPNGVVAISPDGTIYVAVGYLAGGLKSVVRVAGTNAPQPAAMTTLPGINTIYHLQIGEVLPDGSAKSLLVFDDAGSALKLVDITQNPPTSTTLATGPVSAGTIGPDGCLYVGAFETVVRIAPAAGGCGFAPSNQAPALALTPSTTSSAQGTVKTLTATFQNTTIPTGTPVLFKVLGANAQIRLATTNASGVATISYSGVFTGTDVVTATGSALSSNQATINWASGPHATLLDFNTSIIGGSAGTHTLLSATLSDVSLPTPAPIAGASVHLALGAASCDAVTNASGKAQCDVLLSTTGALTLTATYAGNAQYQPATASIDFLVMQPVRIDLDGNGQYDALTDGLMLIRSMFGLTGTALTSNAIGPNATRTQPTDIQAYIAVLQPVLDIDGDGQVDALTDGLMILRYLFGLRGASVTLNAIGPNPTRSLAGDIETYIQSLMPPVN